MSVPAPERRPSLPVDTPAAVVISRALAPGEHPIWTGRPPRGLDLRERDRGEAVQATVMFAAEVVLLANVGGPLVVLLNGITTGWYAARALDRLAFQPRRRRRTWYGLTAGRVVVAELVRGEIEVRSTRLGDVGIARLTERADGSGVIELFRPARTWWATKRLTTLDLAADARHVYNLIRDARRAVTEPATALSRGPHPDRLPALVESE